MSSVDVIVTWMGGPGVLGLTGTASLRPTFAFNPPPSLYMEPIISFLPLILPKDHFILYKRRFSSQTELELFVFQCCGVYLTLQGPSWLLRNVEGTSNLID